MSESAHNVDNAAPVSVTVPNEFQGVTLWLGDGAPLTIDDRMSGRDVRDWVETPLQRATAAARLRAIADMLDDPTAYLVDAMRPVSIAPE